MLVRDPVHVCLRDVVRVQYFAIGADVAFDTRARKALVKLCPIHYLGTVLARLPVRAESRDVRVTIGDSKAPVVHDRDGTIVVRCYELTTVAAFVSRFGLAERPAGGARVKGEIDLLI